MGVMTEPNGVTGRVRQVSGIGRAPPCVAEQFFGMFPEKKGVGGPVSIAGVKVSHDRGSGEPADANVETERDHRVELVLSARALAAWLAPRTFLSVPTRNAALLIFA
jgi:hypothetical protein